MDELVVKEHDFQAAKSKIQKYVETAPKDVALPRVREDGGFLNWGDHKVTGTEFNQCIGQVQTSLIALNSSTKAVISEFKEVYKAFEALDKDYIGGIVISVNAAAKASEEAKKASDDISKTIKALKATVEKIKGFQEEVRGDISSLKAKVGLKGDVIKHLDDVDTIWNDVQTQQNILVGFESQLNGFQTALSSIDSFKTNLDKLNHLVDIDSLWEGLYKHYKDYEIFYNKFVAFSSDIDGKFQTQKNDYIRLSEEHKQASDDFSSYTQKVDSTIESLLTGMKDLSAYADRLKSLSHIEDIDNTWEAVRTHFNAYDAFCLAVREFESGASEQISDSNKLISELQSGYEAFHSEYNGHCEKTNEKVNGLEQAMAALNQYADKLKSFSHLEDVDQTWSELQTHYDSYNGFCQESQKFQQSTIEHLAEGDRLVSELQSGYNAFRSEYNDYRETAKVEVIGLGQAIAALNQFTDKLKSISHLEDVDQTWSELQTHYDSYNTFCQESQKFQQSTTEHIADDDKLLSELQLCFEDFRTAYQKYCEKSKEEFDVLHRTALVINQYLDKLKSFAHLSDIDSIWLDLKNLKQKYSELRNNLTDFDKKTTEVIGEITNDVSVLKAYKIQLEGLTYLPKIDELWGFTHALSDRTDEISSIVDKHGVDIQTINSSILDLDSRYKSESEKLSHRIRVNHIIAATTFVFVLTLLILNILNII